MAQTITTAGVSRVNRRFLLLAIVLAILSAVLVYAQLSHSGSNSSSSGGGDVSVVVAKAAIPAGTRLTGDMVEIRSFGQNDVGFQALTASEQAIGQVARYPIAAGEQVLSSKLVDTTVSSSSNLAFVLQNGMRGVAMHVDPVTDAGGLVLPGDHVDVLWIPFKAAPVYILLSDIEVTAVSQTVVDVAPAAPGLQKDPNAPQTGSRTRISEGNPDPTANTVTFMVSPEQATSLICGTSIAQAYGGTISLSVRSFGDTAPLAVNAPPCPPTDLMRQLGIIP